ncbi:MAG TPA: HEPN domain-containing protein [Phycisphaerales bacterium]|nr:HEPN domain-containing protein [Phycisphaerales bacterium]
MAIKRRLPTLDLGPVDELIQLRQEQHGGRPGAPLVALNGQRVGQALNKSCILLLSALLQGYVEDVFMDVSVKTFRGLRDEATNNSYRQLLRRVGNPSAENVTALFLRLGVSDIFDGLTWQRTRAPQVRSKLNEINRLRNDIAHGKRLPQAVTLAQVLRLRNFVEQFAERFARHVRRKF